MAALVEARLQPVGEGTTAPLHVTSPRSRWFVPAACILFSATMALTSTGFLEADEITHFLKARAIWHDWHAVLDIWGRFGANAVFGLVAPLGVTAARLMAVVITALTGIATSVLVRYFVPRTKDSRIARHAEAFAWLLLFAQPCFALNSFTVMTEMLLACCWAWAAAILVMNRTKPGKGILLAGFILGLGGLMRPEGWIAIAAWPLFAYLWLKHHPSRWRLVITSTFFAGLPCLAWYVLGVIAYHDVRWVIHNWPWSVSSIYGKTVWLFLGGAVVSMAIWMWLPITIALSSLRQRDARLLLAAPFLGLFLMHGTLGILGLFGSMSLPRYYISIAPMAAILAVLGLVQLERRLTPVKARHLPGAIIALVLATIAALVSVHWLPMGTSPEYRRLNIVVDELRRRVPPSEFPTRIIANHPYFQLVLNLPTYGTAMDLISSRDAIANAPPGTIVISDSKLWVYEKRPTPADLASWGYRSDETVAAKVDAISNSTKPWLFEQELGRVRLWIKQPLSASSAPLTHPLAPR